jgi:hypothetical protein
MTTEEAQAAKKPAQLIQKWRGRKIGAATILHKRFQSEFRGFLPAKKWVRKGGESHGGSELCPFGLQLQSCTGAWRNETGTSLL